MSNQEIIHGYRHLYRGLLRAVQFSNRTRFIARDHIRRAFRNQKDTFDADAVKRTRWFLEAAAKERGIEHKILKNLLRMIPQRRLRGPTWKSQVHMTKTSDELKLADKVANDLKAKTFTHYDMTIAMLNRSMGMCLR
ncbi:hypothetical protein F5X68DRAFT_79023 [Plectosphaerella plurivora]|uniref:Uncharacterized protein n=1 Tax=Plectosphaerella plurivora TaxID=936078 RepID=A0A9P8VE63_9PEZI|nr:hypothetical protein F5X68DRAFT_79023 [Plectosphaerella plurivora]